MSGDPVVTSRETFVLTNAPQKERTVQSSQDVSPVEGKSNPIPPIQPDEVTQALLEVRTSVGRLEPDPHRPYGGA